MLSVPPPVQTEETLMGREAKVLRDRFFPEAIGRIEKIRGAGTLRAIEIRTYKNQPGPRVRVAFEGGWQLTEAEGGERHV
jgi:hypothetical protein